MILGFKDRFVPFVEDGSKRHSIRAGNRWRKGMRADLFARPRQKGMRLLFRAVVLKVERIEISKGTPLLICIEGNPLDATETDALLWRDGFRLSRMMPMMPSYEALEFWKDRLPFTGQILHWDYDNRFVEIARRSVQ